MHRTVPPRGELSWIPPPSQCPVCFHVGGKLLDEQPLTGTLAGIMYNWNKANACEHLTFKWPGGSSFDILEKVSLIKHLFKILTSRE